MKAIPASLTRLLDPDRVFNAEVHAAGAINRFARLACRQDRQGTIPLRGQNENDVHIFASGEDAEAIDRRGAKLDCHLLCSVGHLIANGPQLKTIGEHPQGRSMTLMPEITQPD